MTQQTASNNNSNSTTSAGRGCRRSGLLALAALGLPLGAMLAPSTAAAAPGDSPDDIDLDLEIDLDAVLSLTDFAILLPNPAPPIPVPFPMDQPLPDYVPDPDDGDDAGPGLPFDFAEYEGPFDLGPFNPDDLVLDTGPGDDDDEPEPEPECNEYAAANFAVDAEHHEGDLIELRLVYSDTDVCDFTVWTAVAEPGAVGVLGANTVGMVNVASATESAGYYHQTLSHYDLCEVEIRVAVEESLAFTVPHTDPPCADEIPGVDGEEPGDEDEIPGDDGEEPGDDDEVPGDDDEDTPEEARPLGEPETPATPSGGLPQTGTNMTNIMFAIGLMTLGAGSVIALATRRREELPIA